MSDRKSLEEEYMKVFLDLNGQQDKTKTKVTEKEELAAAFERTERYLNNLQV